MVRRRRLRRFGVGMVLIAAGAAAAVAHARQEAFPHEQHRGLFPVCEGCHGGVMAGDTANFYPPKSTCTGCHDGVRERRVDYQKPELEHVGLLDFSHPQHRDESGEAVACQTCHTEQGAPRMAVQEAVSAQCLECHAHEAPNHLVAADCVVCHRAFAESGLPARVALDLPVPDPHGEPDFIMEGHGDAASADAARCAVCHMRERCTACHVGAAAAPAIARLPGAGERQVALPEVPARYPEPASHRDPDWLERHGPLAAERPASCITCHTRQSCTSCHRVNAPEAVRRMPDARLVAAPGVSPEREPPASHYTPAFEVEHGTLAASSMAQCAACHARTDCETCHNAPARSAFHPENFAARHASAAYGRRLECSNCHNSERFCRDCHDDAGMTTSGGRLAATFHDAEPLWLLRHGQAARQGLESCTACHRQTDCLQCHSQTGAFQVNPHGPDFDPRRVQKKNARVCFACHVANPLDD